jgi:hypothetical protein
VAKAYARLGTTTLTGGLAAWQESIIAYGTWQGFTVTR